jgi:hypothetical protein
VPSLIRYGDVHVHAAAMLLSKPASISTTECRVPTMRPPVAGGSEYVVSVFVAVGGCCGLLT